MLPTGDDLRQQAAQVFDAVGLARHELRIGENRDLRAKSKTVVTQVHHSGQRLPEVRPRGNRLTRAVGEVRRRDLEPLPRREPAHHRKHSRVAESLLRQEGQVAFQARPVVAIAPQGREAGNAQSEKRALIINQRVIVEAHAPGPPGRWIGLIEFGVCIGRAKEIRQGRERRAREAGLEEGAAIHGLTLQAIPAGSSWKCPAPTR